VYVHGSTEKVYHCLCQPVASRICHFCFLVSNLNLGRTSGAGRPTQEMRTQLANCWGCLYGQVHQL
jgi:hypothetical protein